MLQTKILALNKTILVNLAIFVILLTLAIFAPLLQHQLITGAIVNAALFLATALLGVSSALIIALLPSVISLAVGLLPKILLPMIPFIVLGNGILIVVFALLKQKNYWLSVLSASLLKFLFLWSASSLIIKFFIAQKVAAKIAIMFSWPQLITALSGGIAAYLVLRIIAKTKPL